MFFPTNAGSGGLYLAPFEWPKLLLAANNLDWNDWWLRLQVYEEAKSWKGLTALYSIATIIMVLYAYSTRIIGMFAIWTARKQISFAQAIAHLTLFLFMSFLAMNTLQLSGGFNVFNFFVVALIPLSVLGGVVVDRMIRSGALGMVLGLSLLLLSLPRPLNELRFFLENNQKKNDAMLISSAELERFAELRQILPSDAVIQPLLDPKRDNETPFTPFFLDRYAYLSGVGILESHNQPITERKKMYEQLFLLDSVTCTLLPKEIVWLSFNNSTVITVR
mgnify:CR=1 FL=1